MLGLLMGFGLSKRIAQLVAAWLRDFFAGIPDAE